MKPKIYLALVDDWELRGNGSGDVQDIQVRPMLELLAIYERNGIRGSFNAEVMQQLAFRRLQDAHPELKHAADTWDAAVLDAYRRGHDVQLHIHPQWNDAAYIDGTCQLTSDWSILNYRPDEALRMLTDSKNYLESLIRTINPDYRCVSFRSGSWCIAPSPFMLDLLADLAIVFDMSIVPGVRFNTRKISLDFTVCEETFLPYYPLMTDARHVSEKREPIVCVPTNYFYGTGPQVLGQHFRQAILRIKKHFENGRHAADNQRKTEIHGNEWAELDRPSLAEDIYNKAAVYIKGKHFISDIARLSYPLLCEMLSSIRQRAAMSGLEEVPVILTNHTKDINNLSAIERFTADLARADDVRCITLTQLAHHLQTGRFSVRSGRQPIG